ncbi:MAG: hypothetical protein QE271_12030 [Bacteriovoracaceae bacterium]|nr:hypothetical protein [Bacteriovoracaceae bacterium]
MSEQKIYAVRVDHDSHEKLNMMLKDLMQSDRFLKVSLFKFLSFIIDDYHEVQYKKVKEKMILHFQDKRKVASDKLGSLPEEELESFLKLMEKMGGKSTKAVDKVES